MSARTPAILVLKDGTVFRGTSIGADGLDRRRSRFQHRDDRLSGNPHRSVVLPADRHADLSAHRQLRRQCRRRRGRPDLRRRPRHSRSAAARVELAQTLDAVGVSEARERRRDRRYRYAQADALAARQGRAGRLHHGRARSTSRAALEAARDFPGLMAGMDLAKVVSCKTAVCVARSDVGARRRLRAAKRRRSFTSSRTTSA